MGSQNARKVEEFGGSLSGNAFKLLNSMAWNSYDDPVPASAAPDAKPCVYFAGKKTAHERAFGIPHPDMPPAERSAWTDVEQAQAKAHEVAKKRIQAAFNELRKAGVIRQLQRGRPGRNATYELLLDRLVREENPPSVGRKILPLEGGKTSLNSGPKGGKPSPAGENNPPPEEHLEEQPFNFNHSSSSALTNKARPSPQVTTGKLSDASGPATMMNDEDLYSQCNKYLLDLGRHQEWMDEARRRNPEMTSPTETVIAAAQLAGYQAKEAS